LNNRVIKSIYYFNLIRGGSASGRGVFTKGLSETKERQLRFCESNFIIYIG